MVYTHDVLVVGAGPTGLACAIELQRAGIDTVVVDKGCLVNSIYQYPTNMTWFTTPELLEIGDIPMTSLNDKPGRVEALKYYRRVTDHYRLRVRQYEEVLRVDGEDGRFLIQTKTFQGCPHQYRVRKVILASGFYDIPRRLDVPGEDLPKVFHYWKEAHPYYNQDVIVVGGKNSAAIAALELLWTQARVTLVHRGPGIHDNVKYWIKPNIENRIKAGEITACFNTAVREVRWDSVLLDTPEGEKWIANDWLFALIGYVPNEDLLGRVGVTIRPDTRRPVTHPETLESERPGVYLAGVIVAGHYTNEIFIENGRFHGKAIAAGIARSLDR